MTASLPVLHGSAGAWDEIGLLIFATIVAALIIIWAIIDARHERRISGDPSDE